MKNNKGLISSARIRKDPSFINKKDNIKGFEVIG
jgi:hypothetical protein